MLQETAWKKWVNISFKLILMWGKIRFKSCCWGGRVQKKTVKRNHMETSALAEIKIYINEGSPNLSFWRSYIFYSHSTERFGEYFIPPKCDVCMKERRKSTLSTANIDKGERTSQFTPNSSQSKLHCTVHHCDTLHCTVIHCTALWSTALILYNLCSADPHHLQNGPEITFVRLGSRAVQCREVQ